jgi:hypothetical protein
MGLISMGVVKNMQGMIVLLGSRDVAFFLSSQFYQNPTKHYILLFDEIFSID